MPLFTSYTSYLSWALESGPEGEASAVYRVIPVEDPPPQPGYNLYCGRPPGANRALRRYMVTLFFLALLCVITLGFAEQWNGVAGVGVVTLLLIWSGTGWWTAWSPEARCLQRLRKCVEQSDSQAAQHFRELCTQYEALLEEDPASSWVQKYGIARNMARSWWNALHEEGMLPELVDSPAEHARRPPRISDILFSSQSPPRR